MLEYVEPCALGDSLGASFGDRLNLITGDNGSGKTFLMESAWYALTQRWPEAPRLPTSGGPSPKILYRYVVDGDGNSESGSVEFNGENWRWDVDYKRKPPHSIVVYARQDGQYLIYDNVSAGIHGHIGGITGVSRFSPSEILRGNWFCKGMIRDWKEWSRDSLSPYFEILSRTILTLDPTLRIGRTEVLQNGGGLRIPTLSRGECENVLLINASPEMRRTAELAYILTWKWKDYIHSCRALDKDPSLNLILLIDGVDTHLDAKRQRQVLPGLLDAMKAVTGSQSAKTQVIATTYSPLVMASAEPFFDEDRDTVHLMVPKRPRRRSGPKKLTWCKQGDVNNWLVSESFGLERPRSLEAERAINAAYAFMRGHTAFLKNGRALYPVRGLETHDKIEKELKKHLPGHDPFWPQWERWPGPKGK